MTARRIEDFGERDGLLTGSDEDKQLALAFKRGERDADRAIYERYAPRVHRLCRRMLHQPDDAQEAAQETFLRVYQGLHRFNGRYQLGAWITRIATNVCLDYIRARSRRPVQARPVEEAESHAPSPAEVSEPEVVHLRRQETAEVRKTLASLPPLHRAAIVLRDFEGLTYAEIAHALEMTEGQVKALLHRARRGFKRSWTSALMSALIPARWLDRLRGWQGGESQAALSGAQAATTAAQGASPVVQAAASCSTMLQQCGTFVTERVASIVTVAMVGTAAATGAVGAQAGDAAPQTSAAPVRVAATAPHDGAVIAPSSIPDGGVQTPGPAAPEDEVPEVTPSPSESPVASPDPEAPPAATDPGAPAEAPPAPGPAPTPGDGDNGGAARRSRARATAVTGTRPRSRRPP